MGRTARRTSNTATRTACARIRRATSTFTTPSMPPAKATTPWWSSTPRASSSSLGQGIQGRRSRPAHPQRRQRPSFCTFATRSAAVVVKATLDGEEVWHASAIPKQSEAYKPGADGKKPKYSPTNLAIAPNGDIYVGDGYGSSYINQYNKQGRVHPHLRRQGQRSRPVGLPARHHRGYARRHEPILTVADRGNNRIQRFTLDGKHIDFIERHQYALPFQLLQERRSVVPDLGARVTLLDKQQQSDRASGRRFRQRSGARPAP